jgi:predicted phage tail protein
MGWPEQASDRNIRLHGALAAAHGAAHRRAVSSVSEAIRACLYTIPDFDESLKNGEYQIFLDDKFEVGADDLGMRLGSARTIDIYPVIGGHKKGLGKILAGVLLVTLVVATGGLGAVAAGTGSTSLFGVAASTSGFWGVGLGLGTATLGSAAAMFGVSMIVSGITSALAPTPEIPKNEESPSFLFNSTMNVTQEGNAVPIALGGPLFAASAVISGDMETEHIALTNNSQALNIFGLPSVFHSGSLWTPDNEVTWGGFGGFLGFN